jgi:PAS domain S-box-containing protein
MKDSETEIHTKDGRRLIISWTSNIIRDKQGRIKGSLFIGNDITEKRRAEEEIAGIKHHLETVLDGISESIVVLDHKYRIVSYNKAFRNWVKEPLSDFRGKKCFRIIHGALQSCRKCVIRDVFSRKGPSESIHYHQTKNGRIYHETRAYPIFRDGKITESIYVFRDVSEREQMREQLRDNYEKLVAANQELMKLDRMKTEFLSIASHELRTPLAVIKGYADILTSGDLGGLNLEQKSRLERINRNVEHLDILVNNILDLTRMEAGELRLAKTRFSLQRLIRVVTDDMANIARQKGIRIDITVSAKTRVFADRMRLRQVLVNIIDNALKFTPDNGAVKISSWQRQGRLFVEVSDNGIGIRKKDIKNLFQRFYQVDSSIQRKYRGTGLGLAICKRIVELHGGEISIKSKHKKGTTISFTIPSK